MTNEKAREDTPQKTATRASRASAENIISHSALRLSTTRNSESLRLSANSPPSYIIANIGSLRRIPFRFIVLTNYLKNRK